MLQDALSVQKRNGGKLGQILIKKGHITNQKLSQTLKLQEVQNEHQN